MAKNHPVCKRCGSDEVQFDAYVQWDREVQDWSVTFVAEKPVLCEGECAGKETTVVWTGDDND